MKKDYQRFSVLSNFVLAFVIFFLILFAAFQTCETRRIANEVKDMTKAAEQRIDLSKQESELAKREVDLLIHTHFPKLRVVTIISTNFPNTKFKHNEGFIYNARDWNLEGKSAKFEIIYQGISAKQEDTKIVAEYLCYAYDDPKDRSYNRESVLDTITLKASNQFTLRKDITAKIISALDLLDEHYGGKFPDNLTMEVILKHNLKTFKYGYDIEGDIYYIIGNISQ